MDACTACSGLTSRMYCIPRLVVDLYSQTSRLPSGHLTKASTLPEKSNCGSRTGTSSWNSSRSPASRASLPALFSTSATA